MASGTPKNRALSLTQLHQGFLSALIQAERLGEESVILNRKRRFAGALSKAILGLEEIGKNRLFLFQAALIVRRWRLRGCRSGPPIETIEKNFRWRSPGRPFSTQSSFPHPT